MSKYKLPIVLYDSDCTLCSRFKQALNKAAGDKITTIPLNDEEVYRLYPTLSKNECKKTLHLLDQDQNIHAGGDAISFLITQFPAVAKFAWLIESGMGKKAIDYFYNMTDKYRKSFSKYCSSCQ